jgi:hypothetical protein
LLARDLNAAMAGGNAPPRVALLLDTHESFWDEKRDYQGDRFFYQDEWLRRFLRELELADGIIAVVAGRELPRWQEAAEFTIPQDCIESQLVGDFSRSDALVYLQKAQIEGEALQQAILNYASSALSLAPNYVYALNNFGLVLIKLRQLLLENSQEAEAAECLKRTLEAFNRSLEIAPGNDYIRNLRDQLSR